jgi:hypothetical protein
MRITPMPGRRRSAHFGDIADSAELSAGVGDIGRAVASARCGQSNRMQAKVSWACSRNDHDEERRRWQLRHTGIEWRVVATHPTAGAEIAVGPTERGSIPCCRQADRRHHRKHVGGAIGVIAR